MSIIAPIFLKRRFSHVKMNFSTGFTMVELIVVVIIIAILTAVALPSYRTAMERSRQTEGIRILNVLREAHIRYYSEYGHFSADTGSLALINQTLDVTLVRPKYFSTVYIGEQGSPLDPVIAQVTRDLNVENPGFLSYNIRVKYNGSYEYQNTVPAPGGLP